MCNYFKTDMVQIAKLWSQFIKCMWIDKMIFSADTRGRCTLRTEGIITLWPCIPLNNILTVNLLDGEIPLLTDYSAGQRGLGF